MSNNGLDILIPISALRDADFTPSGVTPPGNFFGGRFRYVVSPGSVLQFTGNAGIGGGFGAEDVGLLEVVLPHTYRSGHSITFSIVGKHTEAGAPGTRTNTINVHAWKVDTLGNIGAELIAASAQNLTNDFATYDFVIDGTTLMPGDRLLIRIDSFAVIVGGFNTFNTFASMSMK